MPEGHTVRRMADDHARSFAGRPVRVASPQGRFSDGAARVDGLVLAATDAHGKHLFHRYAPDAVVHVHLGLYGTFTAGTGTPPAPRGELRMRLVTADDDEPRWLDLRGPSTCEVLDAAGEAAVHARLGADPLRRRDRATTAWQRIARSRQPIGALLMDQAVVAGVGNIYRAEVLLRQRQSPFTAGRDLDPEVWERTWADLVRLMRAGVRADRIVTTEPADRDRRSGRARRDDAHYVYRRDGLPCRICGSEVRSMVFYGRNLFWCPTCQA